MFDHCFNIDDLTEDYYLTVTEADTSETRLAAWVAYVERYVHLRLSGEKPIVDPSLVVNPPGNKTVH